MAANGLAASSPGVAGEGLAVIGGDFGRHAVAGQGIAQVKKAALLLLRALLENAILDLERRDALAVHLGPETGLGRGRLHARLFGHPAVALAQKHNDEGPAATDFIQADLEDQELLGLLLGRGDGLHPETQVNWLKQMPALPQPLGQLREDVVLQPVPLRLHVTERAADENRA